MGRAPSKHAAAGVELTYVTHDRLFAELKHLEIRIVLPPKRPPDDVEAVHLVVVLGEGKVFAFKTDSLVQRLTEGSNTGLIQ